MRNPRFFCRVCLPASMWIKLRKFLASCHMNSAVLLKTGLLKPLGKPAPNGHKFFSAAEMLALSENREWLDKATRAVAKCWKDRNLNSNQSE